MSVIFEKVHFYSRKWLLSMVVGEERHLPTASCSYNSVKSSAWQLKNQGCGEWLITKKGCTDCTKVKRIR